VSASAALALTDAGYAVVPLVPGTKRPEGSAMDGRDERGRFAPGNAGGPGRPRRDTERAYLSMLAEACPLERWRAIVQRAVADAAGGDAKAREWLSTYLLGKPAGEAPTLHALAVQEATGYDPVQEAVATVRGLDELLRELAPAEAREVASGGG